MAYRQLSVEEREEIQCGLWEKESVRSIVKRLGRAHSSIVREINKNLPPERRVYTPRLAHKRALAKRKSRERGRAPEVPRAEGIRRGATQGGLVARADREHRARADIARGHMPIRVRADTRRQRMGGRKARRVLRPKGPSIDTRPTVVEKRTRLGDREGDSIEGKNHAPGLNSLVDRRSGLLFLSKLPAKTAEATTAVVARRLKSVRAHTDPSTMEARTNTGGSFRRSRTQRCTSPTRIPPLSVGRTRIRTVWYTGSFPRALTSISCPRRKSLSWGML